jgi:hypothetical protein
MVLGLGQIFLFLHPLETRLVHQALPISNLLLPILVFPNSHKGKNLVDDVVGKGQKKKRRKCMTQLGNSKMLGQHNYNQFR